MERNDWRSSLIILGNVVLVPFAYAAAYLIRFGTLSRFQEYFSPIFLLMMTASYIVVFYLFDFSTVTKKTRVRTLAARIVLAVGVSAVFVSLLKYVFFLIPIGRGVLVLANTLLVVLVFVWQSVGAALFIMLVRQLGNIPPAAPGRVGLFEISVIVALAAFGVARTPALCYAVMLHLVTQVPKIIIGGAFVGIRGLPRVFRTPGAGME